MPIGRDVLTQFERLLQPMKNRLANMVTRTIVKLANDGARLQLLQLAGLQVENADGREAIEDAEHFQPYGFFAIPLAGAEAVLICPNGDRGHPIVVSVSDRRYRPTGGQGGETGLYTDEGDQIRLARGHVIVLSTTGTVKIGSSSAADGAIKGTTRNTAEQTFLNALGTVIAALVTPTGIDAASKTAFATALATWKTAAAGAVSTKVKVE